MDKINQDLIGGVLTQTFTDEATGKMHITKSQDISANIDYATTLRNADQFSRDGIKKGMWHVAHIPDIVIVELRQIGVDVFKASAKQIVAGIKQLNKEYLLTTTKQV